MLKGETVFEDNKDGKNISIRYFDENDAKILWKYINKLSQEKTFVLFQGEKILLEHEQKYVKYQIKKIKEHKSIQLLLFIDGQLSGVSGIEMKDRVASHIGDFSISISKEARGKGLGKLFMNVVIKEAINNLPDLRLITLGVFSNNPIAHNLYKKFDFIKYGTLPKGVFYKGEYIDEIKMYKEVKSENL